MTKLKTKIYLAIVLFVILFANSIIPIFAPKISALSKEELNNPTKRSQIYQATKALTRGCDEAAGFFNKITLDDPKGVINNGDIYNINFEAKIDDNPEKVGYIIQEDDGQLACGRGTEVQEIFEMFEMTPYEFLSAAGIYKLENKDGKVSAVTTTSSKGERRAKIYDYVNKTFGIDASKGLAPASQYITLQKTYDKTCKKDSIKYDEGDGVGTPIKIVDSKGNISTEYRQLKTPNEHKPVGWGISQDAGGDRSMECKNIVKAMNDTADAYSAAVKDLLAQGIDPSGSLVDSDSKEGPKTCTEQFGISFGWVVCQALEAIGSTVEKIFNYVDGLLNIDAQVYYDNEQLKTVWSYFRNIATFLLIIVGLVMIASQAMGSKS